MVDLKIQPTREELDDFFRRFIGYRGDHKNDFLDGRYRFGDTDWESRWRSRDSLSSLEDGDTFARWITKTHQCLINEPDGIDADFVCFLRIQGHLDDRHEHWLVAAPFKNDVIDTAFDCMFGDGFWKER